MNETGIKNIEISVATYDKKLVQAILKKHSWEKDKEKIAFVESALRYNVFTFEQFAGLLGIEPSSLHNKIKPSISMGKLVIKANCCYPFRGLNSIGTKFIVRDELSEKMLVSKKRTKK